MKSHNWECLDGVDTNEESVYRRSGHSITSLTDGSKLFLIGGAGEEHLFAMNLFSWSTSLRRWDLIETPLVPNRRLAGCFHGLNSRGADFLFLFGGYDGDDVLNDCWIFDVENKTWKDITIEIEGRKRRKVKDFKDGIARLKTIKRKRPSPRSNFSSSIYEQDKVIVFGGLGLLHRDVFNDIFIYNHKNCTFKEIKTKSRHLVPLLRSSGMVIFRQQVFLYGGYIYPDRLATDRMFKLNLKTKTWGEIIPRSYFCPKPRMFCNIAKSSDTDHFYIFGGRQEMMQNKFSDCWRFDINSSVWEEVITENSPIGRSGSAFCLIGNDFYVHGGSFETETAVDQNNSAESNKMSSLWKLRIPKNQIFHELRKLVGNWKPYIDMVVITN